MQEPAMADENTPRHSAAYGYAVRAERSETTRLQGSHLLDESRQRGALW